MKSRKKTIKRGGAAPLIFVEPGANDEFVEPGANDDFVIQGGKLTQSLPVSSGLNGEVFVDFFHRKMTNEEISKKKSTQDQNKEGGSKHKSKKSRKSKKSKKTKKGRGDHEGGKKKCPKHCHRKTRRTRKGLKHRKN